MYIFSTVGSSMKHKDIWKAHLKKLDVSLQPSTICKDTYVLL